MSMSLKTKSTTRSVVRGDPLDLLLTRRSVPPRHLVAPGPTDSDIERMISAAMTAPNHGALISTRFMLIEPVNRDRLADLFVEAEKEVRPLASGEALNRAREKALNGACLLAVVNRTFADHPDISVAEQTASTGAALGFLLLSAHALGFAAMAVSGEKTRTHTLRKAFALEPYEGLLCFVAIGTPIKTRGPRGPAQPDQVLSVWSGV